MTQQALAHPQPAAHSRRSWLLIILVICLTALAVWLVPDQPPAEVELPPLPAVIEEAPATAAGPVITPANPNSEPAAAADIVASSPAVAMLGEPPRMQTAAAAQADVPSAPGAQARHFIAALAMPDARAAVSEAERQQQAGRLVDAYLLHFYAARLGHDGAALILAHQADPTFHDAATSPLAMPDISLALRWYDMAAEAGNSDAVADRQRLRQRLELAAAAGDLDAQRLTLQWQ